MRPFPLTPPPLLPGPIEQSTGCTRNILLKNKEKGLAILCASRATFLYFIEIELTDQIL